VSEPVLGSTVDEAELDVAPITDEELTAIALAADPDGFVPDDAPSLWELQAPRDGLLPDWYMPVSGAGTRRLRGWRRNTAWVLVGTFLAIDAVGLCTTYGPILHP
jgi:hypothetical protein